MITDRANPFCLLPGKGFLCREYQKLVSGIPTSGMIKGVGNTDILFYVAWGMDEWDDMQSAPPSRQEIAKG